MTREELIHDFLKFYRPNDMESEHLKDTPKRVVKMFDELLAGYISSNLTLNDLKTFPCKGRQGIVIQSKIPFYSLCSHHVIPFFGHISVAYEPHELLLGLSKFARIIKHYSARLQVQEQLIKDITDALVEVTKPHGVAVACQARHLCMEMRGIRSCGSETTTFYYYGTLLNNVKKQEEFRQVCLRG